MLLHAIPKVAEFAEREHAVFRVTFSRFVAQCARARLDVLLATPLPQQCSERVAEVCGLDLDILHEVDNAEQRRRFGLRLLQVRDRRHEMHTSRVGKPIRRAQQQLEQQVRSERLQLLQREILAAIDDAAAPLLLDEAEHNIREQRTQTLGTRRGSVRRCEQLIAQPWERVLPLREHRIDDARLCVCVRLIRGEPGCS